MRLLKNYIKNKLKNLVIEIINNQTYNIKLELQKRALSTTTRYVEKFMSDAKAIDDRYKLHDFALNKISINDGIVIEFGVYKGESINYIARKLPEYDVYGFDSFQGLPEFWREGFDQGVFAINKLPKVEKNVKLIKRLFEETLPKFVQNERRKIAYLHIDCDLYSSTKTVFNFLNNQIVSGTVIVFDEYFNYPGWQNHEFKAFKEFIQATGLKYKYLAYNYLHEQVAVIIL